MTDQTPRFTYPLPRTDPVEMPAEYTELREHTPVCPIALPTGDPAWMVTRHDDVKVVLSDRRFSREAVFATDNARYQKAPPQRDSILSMDPPRHTRVRKLAALAFSARRVQAMRPHIERIAAGLVDEMAAMTPPVDLNVVFGRALTLRVICDMLGVPFEDHAAFGEWTARMLSLTNTADEIAAARAEMRSYFTDLVASKRAHPTDDLMTAFITQSDENGTLTESEVVLLGLTLLIAGHDTSVSVIASAAINLMRNPDQLALLQADPDLYAKGVDELIRLSGPGGGVWPRVTTEDVELGGVLLPKGSAVLAYIGTACRDASVFPDPERLDLHREVPSQIAFGHGPHYCLGAELARAEMELGLRALFGRFPDLRLAVPSSQLRWRDFAALGGWEEVPVTWSTDH